MQALVSDGKIVSLFGFEGESESRKREKFLCIPFRKYAPLAQLVEQLTLNQWVPGSNP